MQLPRWTFEDAYGDFDDARFTDALSNLDEILGEIERLLGSGGESNLLINAYERGFEEVNSLLAFCRCKSSDDTKDERAGAAEAKIREKFLRLERTKEIIFEKMDALDPFDTARQTQEFARIKFLYDERKNSWRAKFDAKERKIYEDTAASSFTPLYGVFRHLNNLIAVQVTDKNGVKSVYNLSKCAGVLKGSPDAALRKSVFEGLAEHYARHASLYADVLNLLQGFRLGEFSAAGTDILTPSLQQNKISEQAVTTMFAALDQRADKIRECVSLRAKYFPQGKIYACDLLAPSPFASADDIPYERAIETICAALGEVGEEIPKFIKMMLEKNWIEAQVRENKAGGAFYTRFDKFRQPRVFSSYMGTQAHMIQQAHELGHAWHYWIMRDLPALHTQFPMTLAEAASTFNEAVLRNYLRKNSSDKNLLFDILWQELKSAANFMLHIGVRFDFEIAFLKARQKGAVGAAQIEELMQKAWRGRYGDTTQDVEGFLPYFKLHFYKTDQYIYNYPYAVGYLLSQFLLGEFRRAGDKFIGVYKAFLRECGVMSVEELLQKHFGKDARTQEFWLECVDNALVYADEFKRLEEQMGFDKAANLGGQI